MLTEQHFFKDRGEDRQDEIDTLPASGLPEPVLFAATQRASEAAEGPGHDLAGPHPDAKDYPVAD